MNILKNSQSTTRDMSLLVCTMRDGVQELTKNTPWVHCTAKALESAIYRLNSNFIYFIILTFLQLGLQFFVLSDNSHCSFFSHQELILCFIQ